MNSSDPNELYARRVVAEMALHIHEPNSLQRFFERTGRPLEAAMRRAESWPVFHKIPPTVEKGIASALQSTVTVANKTIPFQSIQLAFLKKGVRVESFEDIAELPLEVRDEVADSLLVRDSMLIGAEGVIMGLAAGICAWAPGAQFILPGVVASDVYASMTFLSRHSSLLAGVYGYSPTEAENVTHVLASMVPLTRDDFMGQKSEGRANLQTVAENARLDLLSHSTRKVDVLMFSKSSKHMIKLIQQVSGRLKLILTEKQLGMLVPFLGVALNSGVNMAFQQVAHTASRDYFRRLELNALWGEAEVNATVLQALDELKAQG